MDCTTDVSGLGREEATGEEVEEEGGVGEGEWWMSWDGGVVLSLSLSCCTFSSCRSLTGEGEDSAACEAEFGCLQDASVITVSGTEQGGDSVESEEVGGGEEGVEGVADGVDGEVHRDAQLLFFVPAAFEC